MCGKMKRSGRNKEKQDAAGGDFKKNALHAYHT
jgi:hypothetical protein